MEKNRRKFLIASAATTFSLVAGCSTEEPMEGGDHNDGETTTATTEMISDPTNTPTMTATSPGTSGTTPTSTSTPTPTDTITQTRESNVSIESSELQKQETSYGSDAYIIGTIVNNGNGISGELSVKGRFYDGEENLLDSTTVYLHYLKPGETWVCHIPYFDDGAKVASHKIDGEYRAEVPKLEVEGLTVTETSLSAGSFEASVTGVLENELEEDADYLAALTRFWKDDTILGQGLDSITEVPAGENWSFDAPFTGYSGWEAINDYDVIPELRIY